MKDTVYDLQDFYNLLDNKLGIEYTDLLKSFISAKLNKQKEEYVEEIDEAYRNMHEMIRWFRALEDSFDNAKVSEVADTYAIQFDLIRQGEKSVDNYFLDQKG